jgi:allophanate hydrolase subunit 2
MDRLAQHPHGTLVGFELIRMQKFVELLLEYERTLQKIQEDLA